MNLSTGLFDIKAVHIEPSGMCQATCSRCPRAVGTNKQDTVGFISFNDYEQHIAPYLYQFGITFCGNYGDPMMNPDMAAIAIDAAKRKNRPSINTNGGIGKTQDYYDMAAAGVRFVFDVEGSNQEVHERYRRGVNFANLKKNIQSAYEGWDSIRHRPNNARLEFYVIPWTHTIADLANIVELAKSVEANIIIPRPRHLEGGTPCFDRNGVIIDVISLNKNWISFNYGTYFYNGEVGPYLDDLLKFDWGDPIPVTNDTWYGMQQKERVEQYKPYVYREGMDYFNRYDSPVKVNCKVEKQNSVFISYDLKLLPCCHLGTHITGETAKLRRAWDDWIKVALNHYAECGDDTFDLKSRKFDEIVNDPIWRQFAFGNLEGNKVLKYCEVICGLCK
jgi:hypothetical protein